MNIIFDLYRKHKDGVITKAFFGIFFLKTCKIHELLDLLEQVAMEVLSTFKEKTKGFKKDPGV
jgi:hypothetical protein